MDLNDPPELKANIEPDELEEQGLVWRAVRGEVNAFGELYQRHVNQIYRYIAYRLTSSNEVEDLTAQVFLNAWKAIGKYQPTAKPFLAWLYTLAHNQVINHLKAKQQKTIFTTVEQAYDLFDTNSYNTPELRIERQIEFEELRQAVCSLPDDQQLVIYLRYVEELAFFTIAELMGKPEATVRGISFRAHQSVRKILKKEAIFGAAD